MSVSTIDRTIGLIEALAAKAEAVELSALAAEVGLPLSTAHRILTALAEHGLVVHDASGGTYQLSLRLAVLAFRNLEARAVPSVMRTVLDRLAARTREYCRLAIAEGDDLIWVASAQGAPAGLRYEPDMGAEIPLHATANGKAWLATMDDKRARAILSARGLKPPPAAGRRCLKKIDDVMAAVRKARAQGFGTALEEAETGTAAVAVAFRSGLGADAPVAGTISVAGPLTRITPERYETYAEALKVAAQELAELWPIRAFTGEAVLREPLGA